MRLPALRKLLSIFALAAAALALPGADAQPLPLGVVVMHGKGGMPQRYVSDLAEALARNGYLVANLEMPWSRLRNFAAPVAEAEAAVAAALSQLRDQGAKRSFVAGHSLGGAYALYLAGRLDADGYILIAPGGDVSNPFFRQSLVGLPKAEELVAAGKGDVPTQLEDYEGGRGTYTIETIPVHYLAWHAADSPMNMTRAVRAANPGSPVLFIIPTRDYPGLLRSSPALFAMLPRNPLTRLYRPDSDHLNAPGASAEEIVRWTREVAAMPRR